ncbi:hypothetical protein MSG28_000151 [Choristoneura fumiferana]|uniref:Uncharacterized protein n=1 Tax=Choristoneura fumiferana TaxID=7141 RepID=A0ACC0JZX9_CHOFU|nr:hypothetical protein MSG28_000151 [Choristoneura fumiferana]
MLRKWNMKGEGMNMRDDIVHLITESLEATAEVMILGRRGTGGLLVDAAVGHPAEILIATVTKNYCQTSEDFIEKMEKWSKEHNHEEEEAPKMWYRSSPAELYYKPAENGVGVQQTQKLERICDTFFKKVIERGRKARPEVDELPPLKPPKAKMCKHRWRWRCLLGARQLLCEPETAPGECWAHGPSRSRARRCRRATPRPQPPPAPPPPPPTLCSAQGRTVTDSYAI